MISVNEHGEFFIPRDPKNPRMFLNRAVIYLDAPWVFLKMGSSPSGKKVNPMKTGHMILDKGFVDATGITGAFDLLEHDLTTFKFRAFD